jgi:DNA adenine methylase
MPETFLKWAGGKRWLVSQHERLFPLVFGRYVEPFLGSGAVFFHLNPERAILSDSNADLINTYRALQSHPDRIRRLLVSYQKRHTSTFYYYWRRRRPRNPIHKAAQFLYLNRVCWNGLYRVNLDGQFNVPLGTKTKISIPRGYLRLVSRCLHKARILHSDFEDVIDKTDEGDFLYVDPPYTVMHNNNNFLKYNDVLFSWEDQKRLAAAVKRASKRGTLILVSNANHNSVRQLYRGFGSVALLRRASVLAGDATSRRQTAEVTFRNYLV